MGGLLKDSGRDIVSYSGESSFISLVSRREGWCRSIKIECSNSSDKCGINLQSCSLHNSFASLLGFGAGSIKREDHD
jgi:hypothetical protein